MQRSFYTNWRENQDTHNYILQFTYDRLGRQKVAQTFLSAHYFSYDEH